MANYSPWQHFGTSFHQNQASSGWYAHQWAPPGRALQGLSSEGAPQKETSPPKYKAYAKTSQTSQCAPMKSTF